MRIHPFFISLAAIISFSTLAIAKDSDIETRGELTFLSATSVTVGSLTCNITGRTEYKDEKNASITAAEFSIGDIVKLKCRDTDAKELELKSNDDNGSGNNDNNNGRDDNKPTQQIKLETRLTKVEDVESRATGKVDYSYKRDGKGRTDVKFTATVRIPVPHNGVPILTDTADASALTLVLSLSRRSVDYAHCVLVFDKFIPTANPRFVEYKLDLRNKRGNLEEKKGSCDSNLNEEGLQSGIPGLKRRDNLIVEDLDNGNFLEGTLKLKNFS